MELVEPLELPLPPLELPPELLLPPLLLDVSLPVVPGSVWNPPVVGAALHATRPAPSTRTDPDSSKFTLDVRIMTSPPTLLVSGSGRRNDSPARHFIIAKT